MSSTEARSRLTPENADDGVLLHLFHGAGCGRDVPADLAEREGHYHRADRPDQCGTGICNPGAEPDHRARRRSCQGLAAGDRPWRVDRRHRSDRPVLRQRILGILLFWTLLSLPTGAIGPVLDAATMRMTRRNGSDFGTIRAWGTVGFMVFNACTGFLVVWFGSAIAAARGAGCIWLSLRLKQPRDEGLVTL